MHAARQTDQIREVLAFVTYDDEHHRVALVNLGVLDPGRAPTERRGRIGVDQVAYSYQTLRDLLEKYAHLKALGIEPYWLFTMASPIGNQMEFQGDSYPTNEQAMLYVWPELRRKFAGSGVQPR